jgi:predicted  nucleic acid-binding Zn-ribbon protein
VKLEAKEQLIRMLRIQELALEIARAQSVVENAPMRMDEIEERFRGRNTEYVALKDRYDEIEADVRERNAELATLEESKKKYTADLMQVQNQREYAATLKEIDAVKARISEHEDAVLKGMEETETLAPQIETFSADIEVERKQVEEECAQVEAEVTEARERVLRDQEERQRLENELPASLMHSIRRVEELRQGLFLVKVEDGMCQACYVRVRPQVAQEIKLASHIHSCSQCRRFLYFERSLKPAPAESPGPDQSPPGVEAIDGGAV